MDLFVFTYTISFLYHRYYSYWSNYMSNMVDVSEETRSVYPSREHEFTLVGSVLLIYFSFLCCVA